MRKKPQELKVVSQIVNTIISILSAFNINFTINIDGGNPPPDKGNPTEIPTKR